MSSFKPFGQFLWQQRAPKGLKNVNFGAPPLEKYKADRGPDDVFPLVSGPPTTYKKFSPAGHVEPNVLQTAQFCQRVLEAPSPRPCFILEAGKPIKKTKGLGNLVFSQSCRGSSA